MAEEYEALHAAAKERQKSKHLGEEGEQEEELDQVYHEYIRQRSFTRYFIITVTSS